MASIRLSRLFNKKWYLQTYPEHVYAEYHRLKDELRSIK